MTPRYMPEQLNGNDTLPAGSTAISPPEPPMRPNSATTVSLACSTVSPRKRMRLAISCPAAWRVKYSPLPGGGPRATGVIRPCAGAEHGAVANAAGRLAGHATGGGSGRYGTGRITGDGT